MRLTAILLLTASIHVSANTVGQTVTYSGKDVSLEKVLHAIKDQTSYLFFYRVTDLAEAHPVSVQFNNEPLLSAMDILLSGQPLTYAVVGHTIAINRKMDTVPAGSGAVIEKQLVLKGRVTGSQGEPLVGATVAVKNGKLTTITNEKGYFELKNVTPRVRLVISYSGYQMKEIEASTAETVAVTLVLANNTLDEAQIIAYGTTTQRMATGDVTVIKADEIARQPVNNPLLALEGEVPGLFITQSNGLSGSGVTVRIQGQNSVLNNSNPLYVIDGVPYMNNVPSNLAGGILGYSTTNINGITTGAGNPMSFINPSDIESIAVLKDADATAIYGSRAANGVILITTKKGSAGELKVNFNLQQGVGQVPYMIPLMNTKQYVGMRDEAFKNDGATPNPNADYDLTFWDTTRYTNWQKALIGGSAQYTNFNGEVSGGSVNTNYLVGATYHRETTVFPGDFSDVKASLHFNLNGASTNQKFHFGLSGNFLYDNNHLPEIDLTGPATQLPPDAPALYNKDGSLNWDPDAAGASTFSSNPVAANTYNYSNQASNLISHSDVSYEFLKGLILKSGFGYSSFRQDEFIAVPLSAIPPEYRQNFISSTTTGNSNVNSWIMEPQLTYTLSVGRNRFDALVGSTIQQNNRYYQEIDAQGYNSDAVMQNLGAATKVTGYTTDAVYKYNALFGRINYIRDDRYIVDLNARRDGSSRFGPKNEFHDFGSVGAAWVFSKESFVERSLSWLSFGKIRVSYGTIGNDDIGDYRYLNLYNSLTPGVPYQGASGLIPSGLTNPYLEWEETRKWQAALDLGFFNDRILIDAVAYRNRSSNELLNYGVPITTGFNFLTENVPAIFQNSGAEFTLNTVNVRRKKFSWRSSFNITLARDKVVSFPGLSTSPYKNSWAVGRPFIGMQAVFRYAGVNPQTGEYQYYTSKGQATDNPNFSTDRTDTVNTAPRFYGGFDNKISYKGFELDILLQYTKQLGMSMFAGYTLPGYAFTNQPLYVMNHWQHPGDIATHQRYNQDATYFPEASMIGSSNAGFADASYIRVKNVSLSWQLPASYVKKMHLQSARLSMNAQNLFTLTSFRELLDPETQSVTGLPTLRVVTFGLQLGM